MPLQDAPVPVRYKLAAIWTSVMFLYIYVDYFELYVPGKLQAMLAGTMGPLGAVTQNVLVGTTVMLVVPSLMICLTLALGTTLARWSNIVVGIVYTGIEMLVASGSGWHFYVGTSVLEAVLTVWIAWIAWTWPRTPA